MAEVRAADLPEGSIVALRDEVIINDGAQIQAPWSSTCSASYTGREVDHLLTQLGARVLRRGYGDQS